MGNTAKYLSYKCAWERINRAMNEGFPFEAVSLCESMISDRLLSYLAGVCSDSRLTVRVTFCNLIKKWREKSGAILLPDGLDLVAAVDSWRDRRNEVVHGLVKTMPGEATEDVDSFMVRAVATAEEGKRLARTVCKWHAKELAKSRR